MEMMEARSYEINLTNDWCNNHDDEWTIKYH